MNKDNEECSCESGARLFNLQKEEIVVWDHSDKP